MNIYLFPLVFIIHLSSIIVDKWNKLATLAHQTTVQAKTVYVFKKQTTKSHKSNTNQQFHYSNLPTNVIIVSYSLICKTNQL